MRLLAQELERQAAFKLAASKARKVYEMDYGQWLVITEAYTMIVHQYQDITDGVRDEKTGYIHDENGYISRTAEYDLGQLLALLTPEQWASVEQPRTVFGDDPA